MPKHFVDVLDVVIIRSCQLSCEGCCTFSNHKEINGLVDVNEYTESLKFWSKYIKAGKIHLFGGEPTMHPQLLDWVRLVRSCWPVDLQGYPKPIWLSTNGYFLDKLFDHVDELFVQNQLFLSITHHTLTEPYSSLVKENLEKLTTLIYDGVTKNTPNRRFWWVDAPGYGNDYKDYKMLRYGVNKNASIISITRQYNDHFVSHYQGRGSELKPWHDYNNETAKLENHRECHIKNYVQLYRGRLYKCPPRAVLNQTLDTFNLQSDEDWADYYNQYESIGMEATESEIDAWFVRQKEPENTCNMCGFMYSDSTLIPAQEHLPKKLFKLKPV
jgi:hypothetical protein